MNRFFDHPIAAQYVFEALADESDLTIESVDYSENADGALIHVSISSRGESASLSLAV